MLSHVEGLIVSFSLSSNNYYAVHDFSIQRITILVNLLYARVEISVLCGSLPLWSLNASWLVLFNRLCRSNCFLTLKRPAPFCWIGSCSLFRCIEPGCATSIYHYNRLYGTGITEDGAIGSSVFVNIKNFASHANVFTAVRRAGDHFSERMKFIHRRSKT